MSPSPHAHRRARGGRGRLHHHGPQGRRPRSSVGDTLHRRRPNRATEPLPGYLDVKPMVFAGLFPSDGEQYSDLRDALEKLKLNDASLHYEPETSQALGFGFRVGFLGLLHMEVIRERLEREFDLELIATTPNVEYQRDHRHGRRGVGAQPLADARRRTPSRTIAEPYVKASVIVPKEYVGVVMELCQDRRGVFDHMEYLTPDARRPHLHAAAGRDRARLLRPAEVAAPRATPRSTTRSRPATELEPGQGRHPAERRVRRRAVLIVHRDKAYDAGRALVERLRAIIPRQMFDVPVQAAIGSRVIARETIKAKRKDVLVEVLRRRHLAQAQADREAEEGQEADEAGRHRRGAAGGLPRGALAGRAEVAAAGSMLPRRGRRGPSSARRAGTPPGRSAPRAADRLRVRGRDPRRRGLPDAAVRGRCR